MKKMKLAALAAALSLSLIPFAAHAFNLGSILGGLGGYGGTGTGYQQSGSSSLPGMGGGGGFSKMSDGTTPAPKVKNGTNGAAYQKKSKFLISGTVENGAGVRVFLTGLKGRGEWFIKDNLVYASAYHIEVADENGYFEFPAKPGYRYTVVAWEGTRVGYANSPENNEPLYIVLEDKGKSIRFKSTDM